MSFAPPAPKQHHPAGDLVDPLWGLLDMTPAGHRQLLSEAELRVGRAALKGASLGAPD
jgi:hypothetical protein